MMQTKFKLTILGLVMLLAAGGVLYASGVKDPGVWMAWIGGLITLVTQYSVANAAITSAALKAGNGEPSEVG